MRQYYEDILQRINEAPSWFDDSGVPRFVAFAPEHLSNIYTREAALAEIACQACGRRFRAALSDRYAEIGFSLSDGIRLNRVAYGDPPNVRCCIAGNTMTSEMLEILEYWSFGPSGWTRDPRFEGPVSRNDRDPPDTVSEILYAIDRGAKTIHVLCTSDANRYGVAGRLAGFLVRSGRLLVSYPESYSLVAHKMLRGEVSDDEIAHISQSARQVALIDFSQLSKFDVTSFTFAMVLSTPAPSNAYWQHRWDAEAARLNQVLGSQVKVELLLPDANNMILDPDLVIDASKD